MSHKEILVGVDTLNGNPYLESTKLTVFDVVSDCEYEGVSEYLEAREQLSTVDLRNALTYCKTRQCDQDRSHCGGCFLRSKQDGIKTESDFINRFSEVRFEDSDEVIKGAGEGVMLMTGTRKTLCDNWQGEKVWLVAANLLDELNSIEE